MKECSNCHRKKFYTQFDELVDKPDGLSDICRSCWKAITAKRVTERRVRVRARYQNLQVDGGSVSRGPAAPRGF